ncbi:sigma D regulator [Moritella yayanosii]|uniref:Putative stationary phase protein, binds sigma 70 RNA polymerase subunit rsd n=1 Tax=Moritella yayanosii TaxID=69539 RepID=A0A330LUI9_9GAMM|nr:sigma D regulator [Moritella yayanosii]SQD79966.1 putative stationary phase protein, binds sigma 70 RNA polymerase subunit rsd [Moritella yayanosii]
MLTKLEQAQQAWGGTHNAIDHWLEERQELIVDYCKLEGLPPFEKTAALPSKDELQAFCQILIDYLSTGHFEVYDQIVSQCAEYSTQSLKLAQEIQPQIVLTTEALVEFNDKYAEGNKDDDALIMSLDNDMSKVGELLEQRFELEDQLLYTLATYHREVVGAE